MSRATMVFADKDGAIDFSLVFDGGFDPQSAAHQHARIFQKELDKIMGAKTDEVTVTQKEESPLFLLGQGR